MYITAKLFWPIVKLMNYLHVGSITFKWKDESGEIVRSETRYFKNGDRIEIKKDELILTLYGIERK